MRCFCLIVSLFFSLGNSWLIASEKPHHPNVIYILADDMGYGDVSAYNSEAKFQTPHIDRLAKEGMRFTDAHTSSSVCTPTRYNILTGRYNWRTHLKSGVLDGYGKPLIPKDRLTLASLCKQAGYETAMIGKWHLGMDLSLLRDGKPDTSKKVKHTPTSNGFDYFWGHGASLDFPPYQYIENETYTSTSIRYVNKQDLEQKMGIDCFMRPGWIADDFKPRQTLEEFFDRSVKYIHQRKLDKPFFLYIPLTSPHTPIIPIKTWQGKGPTKYADFCMQTDAGVGRILKALDDRGIAQNTIVIFTADNGCSPMADFKQLEAIGHKANGHFRGAKADIFDGGHRVPHLLRWPALVKPNTTTGRLTVLGDVVATVADIANIDLPANSAEDSVSFLSALRGKTKPEDEHNGIVHHSVSGQFAIRQGDWKLIFCAGSGGWSKPSDKEAAKQGLPKYQLYNMKSDPAEKNNLIHKYPDLVKQLTARITEIVEKGRSTPGTPQKNDGRKHWKQLNWMKKM